MTTTTAVIFAILGILTIIFITPPKFDVPKTPGAILITGCGSGIGKHVLERLSQEMPNHTIYGIVRRKEHAKKLMEQFASKQQENGNGNVIPLVIDLTGKKSSLEKTIKTQVKEPIVGLFDAAGVPIPNSPIELLDVDKMRQVYDVDVFGLISLLQVVLPLMKRKSAEVGGGDHAGDDNGVNNHDIDSGSGARIVLMGSITSIFTPPYMGADPFRAVETIADALRREVKPSGISVSVIQAGFIQSPIIAKTREEDTLFRDVITEDKSAHQKSLVDKYYPSLLHRDYESMVPYEKMSPMTDVSDVVLDALTNPRPKIKYICGVIPEVPIKLGTLVMTFLPHHIMDLLQ